MNIVTVHSFRWVAKNSRGHGERSSQQKLCPQNCGASVKDHSQSCKFKYFGTSLSYVVKVIHSDGFEIQVDEYIFPPDRQEQETIMR